MSRGENGQNRTAPEVEESLVCERTSARTWRVTFENSRSLEKRLQYKLIDLAESSKNSQNHAYTLIMVKFLNKENKEKIKHLLFSLIFEEIFKKTIQGGALS